MPAKKILLGRHAWSTYAYLKRFLRKLEKHLRRDLFCESCGITDHSLLKVKIQYRRFARNLPKVLIAALKDKKSSHNDKKATLPYKQSQFNYINNQKQKQKKIT